MPALLNAIVLLSMIQLAHTSWWYLAIVGVHDNFQQYPMAPGHGATSLRPRPSLTHHQRRCHGLQFLTKVQKKFCSQAVDIPRVVGQGAQWGIEECQFQFQRRRWNCTTFNETSLFGRVLNQNGRETAYIYAIASAGVVTSVTKACAKGTLDMCSCDARLIKGASSRANWEWGGCSHDVRYGNKFARLFVDSVESRTTPRGLMNLWNNRAGRKAVKSNMSRLCKCHGVSGTCTVKVCWKVIRNFRHIGTFLKNQFDGASKMKYVLHVNRIPRLRKSERATFSSFSMPSVSSPAVSTSSSSSFPSFSSSVSSSLTRQRRKRKRKGGKRRRKRRRHGSLVPVDLQQKRPTKRDLVYLDDSPDFCDYNPTYGSLGTRGRECNITGYGLDGCALMCCGRGDYRVEEEVITDCHCKFHWCCQVICKKCRSTVTRHYCN